MKRYKDLEIKIKKKLSWDFLGSFKSAFKWLWVEFDSLREYIPWDSIKSIDWKTTAKLWDVHVKNYEEEKDLKILFLIENSPSLNFGSEKQTKRQTLEEIFFLLAQSAISTGHSIWIQVTQPFENIPPSKGGLGGAFIDFKRWEENIIKTLDVLNKKNNLSIPPSKGGLGGAFVSKWGLGGNKNLKIKDSLIFLLTDNLGRENTDLKYLNINNEIITINIWDYFENNLSEESFEVDFFRKIWNIFFWKNNKITQYKRLRKNKIEKLKRSLKKQHIEFLHLDNRDNIFLKFYKFFNSYKI